MGTQTFEPVAFEHTARSANPETRLSLWLHVRRYAVPPPLIDTATVRRHAGDWAGACAAAGFDVDFTPRSLARTHGRELASQVRLDLRRLAPDLLRWHMPRVAPDGLLRPGVTLALARYATAEGALHLVARTPPARAAARQRVQLALWDGTRDLTRTAAQAAASGGSRAHPHPRPDRRFRLDLHRHLWDAERAHELRERSGAARRRSSAAFPPAGYRAREGADPAAAAWLPEGFGTPAGYRTREEPESCAEDGSWSAGADGWAAASRWAGEAAALLRAEGSPSGGAVVVRLGRGRRLVLEVESPAGGPPRVAARYAEGAYRCANSLTGQGGCAAGCGGCLGPAAAAGYGDLRALPVLPDAATWVPPDLALLTAGLLAPEELHPLVAAALAPGRVRAAGPPGSPPGPAAPRYVLCRGARHRIGLVGGVLTALDHDRDEVRREELLAQLSGTPLPCLQAVAEAHRRPENLPDVRARLAHGDIRGALAEVEALLGPSALLREGGLRDALEAAVRGRVDHGLFRSGLADPGPAPGLRAFPPFSREERRRRTDFHSRTRQAAAR
ncbi:hypothetical protein [Streptomyces sp. NRRL F-5123]|uniref:hypothetical protein n=1 Tax=Streptomyces sp. NRRL F-5123 TaxID=1463856 RepID=UPI000694411C|nr:hypothetical protein [Streptomyces sp. NRRL F-5123]